MGEPDRAQAVKGGRAHAVLGEIAGVFLKLGIFGFGGPIATMAMMEEEAVRRRNWITAEEFGEIYAVCKLLPGPVSTQMAIYLGQARGGLSGGLVSGVLFILPCFVMVLGLAVLYSETGVVHGAEAVLGGLQAAALAIILFSTWGLGKVYRHQLRSWGIAAASAVTIYFHPSIEPLVILSFGLLGGWGAHSSARASERALVRAGGRPGKGTATGFSALAMGSGLLAARSAAASALGTITASVMKFPADPSVLFKLFWMCCKAGFFVFGTGLAVVPVLEGEAVRHYHWLTHSQFMDGLAVGQITPGPVVITSTFIGYLAARLPGAVAATFGMFLPSFINVLFLLPRFWRKFSGTAGARGFSSYAIPSVVGGILGTTFKLGLITLVGWPPAAIFGVALIASAWLKPPAWLLIPLAGLAGGLLGR